MSCGTNVVYVGGRPSVRMTFTDIDDELGDPTAIEVIVMKPDKTTATYNTPDGSIVNESTGVWLFTFPTGLSDQSGTYWVYVVGSGGGADAASEVKVTVHGTHVPIP